MKAIKIQNMILKYSFSKNSKKFAAEALEQAASSCVDVQYSRADKP
jgi:ribosomal protein L16/L10AE